MKLLLALVLGISTSASAGDMSQFGAGPGISMTFQDITALDFSSSPIVNTSTVSSSGDLNFYASGGVKVLRARQDSSTGGLLVNPQSYTSTQYGNLDLHNTGNPAFYFRRNDTTVTPSDELGSFYWRDQDSSTGGSSVKSYLKNIAKGTWGNGQTMEQTFNWGLSRGGGTAADYMVLSSTGLLIMRGAGATTDTLVSCDTCTLQVISVPGSGVSITGNLEVSGSILLNGTVSQSTRAVHVAGGALTANLTSGVTFYAFTVPSAITLRTLTATIQVAGVGVNPDVVRCNDSAGTGIQVSVSAAAVAGTVTDELGGSANIASQTRVSCHIESANATKPNLSIALGYVTQ